MSFLKRAALAFLLLWFQAPGFATRVTGNGGDFLDATFWDARYYALRLMKSFKIEYLDASVPEPTREWIFKNRELMINQLEVLTWQWDKRPEQKTCAFVLNETNELHLSHKVCYQYPTVRKASELLLHEVTHLLGNKDNEMLAASVASSLIESSARNPLLTSLRSVPFPNEQEFSYSLNDADLKAALWIGETDSPSVSHKVLMWLAQPGLGTSGMFWFSPDTLMWTKASLSLHNQFFPIYQAGAKLFWTGPQSQSELSNKVLVWQGHSGFIYDPVDGLFNEIAWPPFIQRTGASVVWTGAELIIWGGSHGGRRLKDGGVYDLQSNVWTSLTVPDDIKEYGREQHSAVWDGNRMLIWGGRKTPGLEDWVGDPICNGLSFELKTKKWRTIKRPVFIQPAGCVDHQAIWMADKMVIDGGVASIEADYDGITHLEVSTTALYDSEKDAWTFVKGPAKRMKHIALQAGAQMYLLGTDGGKMRDSILRWTYDPLHRNEDNWESFLTVSLNESQLPQAIWTGAEIIAISSDTTGPRLSLFYPHN